jgi:c-di-GMP-binding flagellar brake protein YcgR
MTETAAPAPAQVVRVGVRFEKVSSAAQSELDRFVFALMNRKAKARTPQHERRLAPRVDIVQEKIVVELLPEQVRGALSGAKKPEPRRFKMYDISTTGCSFVCAAMDAFRPRQMIRLRLVGEGLDVQLQAKVIHARTPTLVHSLV